MNKKAQAAIEYMVLICISAAALMSMSAYVRRGIQGRTKTQVNDISAGAYYSPGATTSSAVMTKHIEEGSRSWTEHNSGTSGDLKKSESSVSIRQTVSRSENNLAFAQEPGR